MMDKILIWLQDNRRALVRNSFLIPILLVVTMSISHVVAWYDIGNPPSWAWYLSIAIEVFALASVSAATVKANKGTIWFLFGLVTLIQVIGNVFFTYKEISVDGADFPVWVELIQPLFEDWTIIDHRRLLALFQGGTLPIMSLTALHFYIQFNDKILEEDDAASDAVSDTVNDTVSEETDNGPIVPINAEVKFENPEAFTNVDMSKYPPQTEIISQEPMPMPNIKPFEWIEPKSSHRNDLPELEVDDNVEEESSLSEEEYAKLHAELNKDADDSSLDKDESLNTELSDEEKELEDEFKKEQLKDDIRVAKNLWGKMKGSFEGISDDEILKFYNDIENKKKSPTPRKTYLEKIVNPNTGRFTEKIIRPDGDTENK